MVVFFSATLDTVYFSSAALSTVYFSNAILNGIDFSNAKLYVVIFAHTILKDYSKEEITSEGFSLEKTKSKDK